MRADQGRSVVLANVILRKGIVMKVRRWDVTLFWIAIVTALAISGWRVWQTVFDAQPLAASAAPAVTHADWIRDACLLWSFTLLIMAWLSWRDTRRREMELETIISSVSPDVLMVVNPDRTVRTCNPAVQKMFGYQPTEVIGKKTDLLYSDRRTSKDDSEIHDVLLKVGHHVGLATGRRKDGSPLPLEITTGKMISRGGAVIFVRDITERQRLEQLRKDLVAMLIHDLKSPLTVITICLDMVNHAHKTGKPPDMDMLKYGQQVTALLVNMVHSLLDATKLERGEMHLERTTVDLVTLASEIAGMFSASVAYRRITIHLPTGSIAVSCDRELVGRVLMNLMANAVKFTPEDGNIRIAVQEAGGGVKVSVTDTGCGIPPEYVDKVFDRFAQVKTHRFSYGLGLTFCKLVVEAHGGTIRVESTVGQGSTFWFMLPSLSATDRAGITEAQRKESGQPPNAAV
ncbi:MAG: PAS domain-containing sensor histidine kinase [Kiritimatiellaeota bacterium]|nr:PAS domain-containing sensor histidine kinase [Kiritimatiellota bacterium]